MEKSSQQMIKIDREANMMLRAVVKERGEIKTIASEAIKDYCRRYHRSKLRKEGLL
jgi:hypothetical protein